MIKFLDHFILKQGMKLRISPKDILAFDQDLGIRSLIYYSFNSGKYSYVKIIWDKLS